MTAIHPDGRSLYVSNFNAAAVEVFQLDQETGRPSRAQTIAVTGNGRPTGMAVHPNGRFLYVASDTAKQVEVFAVLGDGTLSRVSLMGGFEGTPGPLFIDPAGRFLFFSWSRIAGVISVPIDPATGALNAAASTFSVTPAPGDYARMAFHPTVPDCVYVTTGFDVVGRFQLDPATGALTIKSWVPFAASNLTSIAVDSSGAFAYACDLAGGQLHALACDAADGSLSYLEGVTVDSPYGLVLAAG